MLRRPLEPKLRTAIAVVNQVSRHRPGVQRLLQCIQGKVAPHRARYSPAYDHPGEDVDDKGHVDEAKASDASGKAEKAPEVGASDATAEGTTQTEPAAVDGKLTRLDVPELQARYLEVVGRPTGSTNKAYMIWKIREAQKGRIPLGPRKNAHREGVTFKVLPLRLESDVVDKLDEAWQSRGIKNRTEFVRGALGLLPQAARGGGRGGAVCRRYRRASVAWFRRAHTHLYDGNEHIQADATPLTRTA